MLHPIGNRFAKFFLRHLAKAWQLSDATGFACFQQFSDGADVKFVVQRFNLFRAQTRDREQLQNCRRKFRAQVFDIFQRAGRGEFFDFRRDRFTDAGNFGERLFVLQIGETSAPRVNRPRCIGVSPDLERVFPFQFEQSANLFQNLRDLRFSHSTYA